MNHLLGHGSLLLFGGVVHELEGLVDVFLGHVTLAESFVAVFLGSAVVGVETGFLQSVVNGLLHLLGFGLLDSYAVLFVDSGLRNLVASGNHGVHRSHLHSDVLGNFLINILLVESNDGREFLVEVVVGNSSGAFNESVVAEFHLLASDAAEALDLLLDGSAIDNDSLHLVGCFGLLLHNGVENVVDERTEFLVVGNGFGFALHSHDSCKVATSHSHGAAFGCIAVFTLSCDSQATLANDFDSFVHVAFGFDQSFLAIYQTCVGEFAQFLDVCYSYCHN